MNREEDIVKSIHNALEVLELSYFVKFDEIKHQYIKLSKKYHPDFSKEKNKKKFEEINSAYELLKKYVKEYRFSFSKEEIQKQFPESYHADRFRF